MRKPATRSELVMRKSFNNKRRLAEAPDIASLVLVAHVLRYRGSPKHKRNPSVYGLEPYRGGRSDRTMCDRDASFKLSDMTTIQGLFLRGAQAGLVDPERHYWWSVAGTGWIFEASADATRTEYHGYPLTPDDPMALNILTRFEEWANREGDDDDRQAAQNCRKVYGLRP